MRPKFSLAAAVGVAAAFAMVACGDSGQDSPGEGPPPATLSQDSLTAWREQASDEQWRLLEDGVLTFDEYEGAVFDEIRCVEGAAFSLAGSPELGPDRRYRYEYSATTLERASGRATIRACEQQYTSLIKPIWDDIARESTAP